MGFGETGPGMGWGWEGYRSSLKGRQEEAMEEESVEKKDDS